LRKNIVGILLQINMKKFMNFIITLEAADMEANIRARIFIKLTYKRF
jgi:hypothetical protein